MLVCRVLHSSGVVESAGRESVFRSDRHARALCSELVVLVTVVGTFSVSKLVVMDAVCVGGEGSRV